MACSNIVVIEDDDAIRETVKEVLNSEGYSVVAFKNGKEAIEQLANCSKPCLILLDLMMPVMDGWEFLEARKNINDYIMAIPVVIVSAVVDKIKNSQGVKAYIKKPVDLDVLLSVVRNHCDHPQVVKQAA
ncbi:MAG: response regulator [Bdellovibrionota bacterium]